MKYEIYYHNHADSIIKTKENFLSCFQEITSTIKNMSDKKIMTEHLKVKKKRSNVKSLSEAINNILRSDFLSKSWEKEAGIFKEPPYNDKNNKKWRLDFAKDPISIEVAFNHGEAVAHNLLKPVLASQLNHVQKSIQTQMAVIITATDELKEKGNFDNAVGTYKKYIEYLKPYAIYMVVPVVIIGLCAPDTFYIDRKSREIKII
tara:strand:+ start:1018 stop:1629 length:612 start_codon:yes stop_codon:yes gene_type:complete